MAFETYQCERYKEYLKENKKTTEQIYKLIERSPFTATQLGKQIGVDYYGISRRLKMRRLTHDEMIKLLDFIK